MQQVRLYGVLSKMMPWEVQRDLETIARQGYEIKGTVEIQGMTHVVFQ